MYNEYGVSFRCWPYNKARKDESIEVKNFEKKILSRPLVICLGTEYAILSLYRKDVIFENKFLFDFEGMYFFGYYTRYLFGFIYKSKKILRGARSYKLFGNINNLVDMNEHKFMGIDGSGDGGNYGFLDEFRDRFDLSKSDKAELMVYLFVTEISFAVYYTKHRLKNSGFEFDFYFFDETMCFSMIDEEGRYKGDGGKEPGIPGGYGFTAGSYDKDSSFFEDDHVGYDKFFPQVYWDKYITNKAESEAFEFFLRVGACLVAENWSRIFFSYPGKLGYEDCFREDGYFATRDGEHVNGPDRERYFNLCINLYKRLKDYDEFRKFSGNNVGIGIGGKIKIRIRVLYWLIVKCIRDWYYKRGGFALICKGFPRIYKRFDFFMKEGGNPGKYL